MLSLWVDLIKYEIELIEWFIEKKVIVLCYDKDLVIFLF